MANAKLMTPLFYQGNFNADGKKMRAILVREVSNGTDTYRLWRRDGKPDRKRPSNTDDAYILYVELGGYGRCPFGDSGHTVYTQGMGVYVEPFGTWICMNIRVYPGLSAQE